eukprot:CAMPEP_0201719952 /NCGR_PEP_ID=MMETSP0593-20130828/5008_1 /ASSEMBLY_ACC=CAM_ASM_000672 /TAXON_ID=267983 /ORGANISM="Skeletonema japonicum, Strain CCMP2506" /LENGTH=47 /DNA_ID= /DNA_START= /DNA_END= /DNA_ORIENTATION=
MKEMISAAASEREHVTGPAQLGGTCDLVGQLEAQLRRRHDEKMRMMI